MSPVTVQKESLPSLSKPWMEQLPPMRAIGERWRPRWPMAMALAPSDTWRKKPSACYEGLKKEEKEGWNLVSLTPTAKVVVDPRPLTFKKAWILSLFIHQAK